MPEWLWQGLLANWLSALLLAAAGVIVGLLKAMRPQLAAPILYGLAASTLLAIIFLAIAGWNAVPPRDRDENTEHKVKRWIDDIGLSSRREEDSEATFHFVVARSQTSSQVHVFNLRRFPSIIVLRSALSADRQFAQIKSRATPREQRSFILTMREKLLLLGLDYEGLDWELKLITLSTLLAVSPSLTQVEFASRVSSVDKAVLLVATLLSQEQVRLGVWTP